MYDGPIRGGTRGGQGDFRWSAVANDKHRENYLGHSINAPVGRWTKHKDVHWYNRDVEEDDTAQAARERAAEIKRIKEQEEDALAAALGYAVPKRDTEDDGPGTGANDIPVKKSEKDEEIERLEKEERRREKAIRKEQRALKRAEKDIRREERDHHRLYRSESRRHDDEDYRRDRDRPRSHRPHQRREDEDDERGHRRDRDEKESEREKDRDRDRRRSRDEREVKDRYRRDRRYEPTRSRTSSPRAVHHGVRETSALHVKQEPMF